MRGVFNWIGIIGGGLLVIVLIAGAAMYFLSEGRLNATFSVPSESMSFHNNEEVVAEGEHLAVFRGCTDCHSEDLGGKAVVADQMLGAIYASNLTDGDGGIGATYSDEDLAMTRKAGGSTVELPLQIYCLTRIVKRRPSGFVTPPS
jgi:hypothetical protein